jgi:hypothetical protein
MYKAAVFVQDEREHQHQHLTLKYMGSELLGMNSTSIGDYICVHVHVHIYHVYIYICVYVCMYTYMNFL